MSVTISRYVGLSSTGITYKSGASSYSSGGFYSGGDRYGGSDSYRGNYKDRDQYEEKFDKDTYVKSRQGTPNESQGNSSKETRRHGRFMFYIANN